MSGEDNDSDEEYLRYNLNDRYTGDKDAFRANINDDNDEEDEEEKNYSYNQSYDTSKMEAINDTYRESQLSKGRC